jgi:hypothetical protein
MKSKSEPPADDTQQQNIHSDGDECKTATRPADDARQYA